MTLAFTILLTWTIAGAIGTTALLCELRQFLFIVGAK